MNPILLAIVYPIIFFIGFGSAVAVFLWVGDDKQAWPTLISGILAFVGSVGTVAGVIWQTRQQIKDNEIGRREALGRKRVAMCAALPSHLKEMCAYTKHCASIIAAIFCAERSGQPISVQPDPPILPAAVMVGLQNLVECLEPDEAQVVADLLVVHQIMSSRILDVVERCNEENENSGVIYVHNVIVSWSNFLRVTLESCLELHVRACAMFEFARRKESFLRPPLIDDHALGNALYSLSLLDVVSQDVVIDVFQEIKSQQVNVYDGI